MLENFEGKTTRIQMRIEFKQHILFGNTPRNRQTSQRRIRVPPTVQNHPMRTGHVRNASASGQYRARRRISDETGVGHQAISDPQRFPFGERSDYGEFAAVSVHAGGLRQEADDAARRDGGGSVRFGGGILYERVQVK